MGNGIDMNNMNESDDSKIEKPVIDVLLVENDQLLAMNLKKYLSDGDASFHFHQAKDGIEALDYLKHRDAFEKASRPQLVILDVNIPNLDGYQVLGVMRETKELNNVPTIVIEDDPRQKDKKRVHTLNASKDFSATIESVRSFLLQGLKARPKPQPPETPPAQEE